MNRGRFITLEGGEGTGKSTQCRLLADHLKEHGIDAVTTREPGGSDGAEEIRALLVTGEERRWSGLTETLLNFAARADHLEKTIRPALAEGRWVVSDRFTDSTRAYQGAGQGVAPAVIDRLIDDVVGKTMPDLTVILDIDPGKGLDRAAARRDGEDRYERMEDAFHARLREAFLRIAEEEPERCVLVDAGGSVEEVAEAIWTHVRGRLDLSV